MPKPNTPMSFIFSGAFIGMLVILLGLSIILKEVFHVSFPFFRVLFGLLLIYFGVRFIAGGFGRSWGGRNSTVFSENKMEYAPGQKDYNVIFGNAEIDLTTMGAITSNKKIEVNVVFGNAVLKLNKNIPSAVEMNTAFGQIVAPDRSSSALGKSTYTTPGFTDSQPHLFVKTNVVFGKLVIENASW